MKRLVVSHYKEDLNWLKSLNEAQVDACLVYHKYHNKNLDSYLDVFYEDSKNIYLANIGREAHTYLMHIVQNYNSLYDLEIFCQGNPFEHCINFFEEINFLNYNIDFKQFGHIERTLEREKIKESVADFNFKYLNNLIVKDPQWTRANFFHVDSIHLDLFGEQMPEVSYLKPYAQFAVSKSCIRSHSIETYKRLLDYFNDNVNYNVMAWHMEYFWHILFRESIHLKYDKDNNFFNLDLYKS